MRGEELLLFTGIIVPIVFLYVMKTYIEIFLTGKKIHIVKLAGTWIGCILLEWSMGILIPYGLGGIMCYFFILIVLCQILYVGTIQKKMIVILSFLSIGIASEVLAGVCIRMFWGELRAGQYRIVGSIFSKFLILFITEILKNLLKEKVERPIAKEYWVVLLLISVTGIFIYPLLYKVSAYVSVEDAGNLLFVAALILVVNVLTYRLMEVFKKAAEARQEKLLYQQQMEFYERQLQMRTEREIEVRKIHHDVQNHYIAMKAMVAAENYVALNVYLEEFLGKMDTDIQRVIKTGHVVIDELVNQKYILAKEKGIEFEIFCEIPIELSFADIDLSVLIGNILDNAVEATEKVRDKSKKICLFIKYKKCKLYICVENPYTGKLKWNAKGHIISTKEDRYNHGMGIPLIEKTVRKYSIFYRKTEV